MNNEDGLSMVLRNYLCLHKKKEENKKKLKKKQSNAVSMSHFPVRVCPDFPYKILIKKQTRNWNKVTFLFHGAVEPLSLILDHLLSL